MAANDASAPTWGTTAGMFGIPKCMLKPPARAPTRYSHHIILLPNCIRIPRPKEAKTIISNTSNKSIGTKTKESEVRESISDHSMETILTNIKTLVCEMLN